MPTATRRKAASGTGLVPVVQGEVVDQVPALSAEQRIREALQEGQAALWKLCEAAYDFDQARGWAALGYPSINAWLESLDAGFSRGSFYRYVNTWQKLVIDQGVKPKQLEAVPMSKAAIVADKIAAGEVRPATALKDAANMPASKLREKYDMPRRGRPPKEQAAQPDHKHSPQTAMKAAAELPWEWVEQAVSGRTPIALREARLKEALAELLAWKVEYLNG